MGNLGLRHEIRVVVELISDVVIVNLGFAARGLLAPKNRQKRQESCSSGDDSAHAQACGSAADVGGFAVSRRVEMGAAFREDVLTRSPILEPRGFHEPLGLELNAEASRQAFGFTLGCSVSLCSSF